MISCNWLINFIADEFLVVSLPRSLVLKNKRLGLFFKLCQISALLLAVVYSAYSGIFWQHHGVKEWGVNVWHGQNAVQVATTGDQLGSGCDNVAGYAYTGDPVFGYTPTSCKVLPKEETNRMLGDKLFVPTFVDEETVWDKCGANVTELCKGHNSAAVYSEANGHCQCTFNEQFLVQNADEQRIGFVYGYEIDVSNGLRSDLRHGGILGSMASYGGSHNMKEQKSDLVTRFLAPDGSECSFGGRSLWQHSDSVGGITGTLNELLACAGVTLDSDPATLVAGSYAAPPHLRTMGFKLEMHLLMREDFLFHITCEVRVTATPVKTALWDNNPRPSVIPGIGASMRRTQRLHGMVIDVHMAGTIKTFSWNQVVRWFVDITVVLTLPSMLVQFVAMYLMGLVSEVYRHTARTKLNIYAKFHSSVAKLMLAEVAFRGLLGKWDGRMSDLGKLTPHKFLLRLQDLFDKRSDMLDPEEIKKMASVVFNAMDRDGNGHVCCDEFIEACTDDGEITLQRMANFFDDNHSLQFMRRVFDDTHKLARQTTSKCSLDFDRAGTPQPDPEGAIDSIDVDSFVPSIEDIMADTNMDDVSCAAKESTLTSNILAAHESTLVTLEKRMQELEVYCEKALRALRVVVQDPRRLSPHASHTSTCPMLSSQGTGGTDLQQPPEQAKSLEVEASSGRSPSVTAPKSATNRFKRRSAARIDDPSPSTLGI